MIDHIDKHLTVGRLASDTEDLRRHEIEAVDDEIWRIRDLHTGAAWSWRVLRSQSPTPMSGVAFGWPTARLKMENGVER